MTIRNGKKREYNKGLKNNQDPYGSAVFRYAERWADMMEAGIMTKTFCDICGKEMPTPMTYSIRELNFCISSYGTIWDICDDCRDELNEFINNHKEEKENDN